MKRLESPGQPLGIFRRPPITQIQIDCSERGALGNGCRQANNDKIHPLINQAAQNAVEFEWHDVSLWQTRRNAKLLPNVRWVSGATPR